MKKPEKRDGDPEGATSAAGHFTGDNKSKAARKIAPQLSSSSSGGNFVQPGDPAGFTHRNERGREKNRAKTEKNICDDI